MRLDVDVLGAEELFAAADGQLLGDVHDLAATVVALARVSLRVLVGHHRADGLEHGLGNEVLGGDQLEVARLTHGLIADGFGDVGIDLLEPVHASGLPRGVARSISAIFSTRRADRKSTRLNSSHDQISYAVFCLKKK